MIRTTSLAEESATERIRYERLQERALYSDIESVQKYAQNELNSYYYARPQRNMLERLAGRMLGPVPSKLTLWMMSIRRDTPLGIATLVASMGTLAGLCFLFPVLSVSPFFWLLEGASHLGIFLMTVVAVIAFFEAMVISFKSYTEVYDNSVVANDGYAEEMSAEYELFHRTGAERWSVKQRFASVVLGALLFNVYMTTFMPVAFSIVMVMLNALLLWKYLLSYRHYGDPALATITVAKLGGTLRRYGYLLLGEGFLIVAVGSSQFLPNLAETLNRAFS